MFIKRTLLCFSFIAVSTLLGVRPVQAQCFDLAEYMIPVNSTNEFTVDYCNGKTGDQGLAGPISIDPTGTFPASGRDVPPGKPVKLKKGGTGYELYSFSNDVIYFLEDTTWGNQCEGPGGEAFYRVYDAVSGPQTQNGNWGGRLPRNVCVGQTYTSPQRIRAFQREPYIQNGSLVECSATYPATNAQFTVEVIDDSDPYAPKNIPGNPPTIALVATGGAGAGERKYYSKGWGLTGFYTATDKFHSAYHPDDGEGTELQFCSEEQEPPKEEPEQAPVFVYPKNDTELMKYMANTGVYCAPKSIHYPTINGEMPPLFPCDPLHKKVAELEEGSPLAPRINGSDRVCNQAEYPIVHSTDRYNLKSLAFPLFRNDHGDVSIEGDLGRILKPGETIMDAMKRLQRPDAAPQFYLTSPETQCLNISRYLQYVNSLCAEYGGDGCAQDVQITLPDGSKTNLLSDKVFGKFHDETICNSFSSKARKNPELMDIIRSVEPTTPKVYKVAFLVQHHWMHDTTFLAGTFYMKQWFADWFTSTRFPYKGSVGPGDEYPGEKLDIFPVWYAAGLAVNEYDEYFETGTIGSQNTDAPVEEQTGEGTKGSPKSLKPYAFDPEQIEIDPATQLPVLREDDLHEENFIGPYVRAYQAVMPPHFIEDMTKERLLRVWQTNDFMKQALEQLGADTYVFKDNRPGAGGVRVFRGRGTIECWAGHCLCTNESKPSDRLDVFGVGENKSVATQCPNDITPSMIMGALPPGAKFDVELLRKLVVSRVNAGIYHSIPYPTNTDTVPDAEFGPISKRSFGQCDPDPFGGYETANDEPYNEIFSMALQAGVSAITGSRTDFLTKYVIDGSNNFFHDRLKSSRTYIILPEEANNIAITQAYIAPMFFSPEMYESLMSGENPSFPFLERVKELQKYLEPFIRATHTDCDGNEYCPVWVGDDPFAVMEKYGIGTESAKLSAFFRPREFLGGAELENGKQYKRNLEIRPDGYAVYKVEEYRYKTKMKKTVDPYTGEEYEECEITGERDLIRWFYWKADPPQQIHWVPVYMEPSRSPSCNDPIGWDVTQEKKSLVQIWTHQASAGENPDPNPWIPGKLAAVNEYFRRMAFTPIHMQTWKSYPKLEPFYLQNAPRQEVDGEEEDADLDQVSDQCKYKGEAGGEITSDITNNDQLNAYICQISDGNNKLASLTKAIWAIEGGVARNAIDKGSGTYQCRVNSAGAVGPMQFVMDDCSECLETDTAGKCTKFKSSLGRTSDSEVYSKYDLCTIEGSLSLAIQKIEDHLNEVGGGGTFADYERAAEPYHGRGSCGCFSTDTNKPECKGVDYKKDGTAVTSDGEDYCNYAARLATTNFANICK